MTESKEHEDFEIDFSLKKGSRKELKDSVVNKFLDEKKGCWKNNIQHVTRYKYFVERLNDGRRIYLMRPAYLNKGIDFQVWVEKLDGEKDKKPSHKNIFEDLIEKKKEDPIKLKELLELINKVWNCEDPDIVLEKNKLLFNTGFSVELLLKILKWLFIEQDITYWNYDGRSKLIRAINKEFK